MPVSTFADPTVAIEPPPQQSEFDWAMVQSVLADPFSFGYGNAGAVTVSAPAAAPEKSWTDVFTGIGKGLIGRLVGGYDLSDPQQLALYHADQEAQQKADQMKTFLWVGGVGVAVVLGALVLRGRGKR